MSSLVDTECLRRKYAWVTLPNSLRPGLAASVRGIPGGRATELRGSGGWLIRLTAYNGCLSIVSAMKFNYFLGSSTAPRWCSNAPDLLLLASPLGHSKVQETT